ncbi:glutaredoxin family protein [Gemmobacter sp. 24YEA27]|uniref:glutaredoxin family protein n=1 Tax=Gemmobacter sp. 24YEA27 TaxID=3040672 RepID=UPI0024B3658E|nr:glutaredoxin family protein [Gemmobacter sp. 24YEA27]
MRAARDDHPLRQTPLRQFDATNRALDQAGIRYGVIDLTGEAKAMDYVQSLGYRQVPVVVIEECRHRAGSQPGKIATLR